MKRLSLLSLILTLFCLIVPKTEAQAVIVFVKENGSGNKTGASWDHAIDGIDFPERVSMAADGDVFYVAAGTYKPTQENDRTKSFVLKTKVRMYGGFPTDAIGTDVSNANFNTYITRLSGDIGILGDSTDNSYHVVQINALSETLIDGFYISGGQGVGMHGAGVFGFNNAVVTINNSVVENNSLVNETEGIVPTGGGIFSAKEVILSNVTVRKNNSAGNGGGVYTANLTLKDCSIIDNTTAASGGGISITSGILTLQGTILIERNKTSTGHGGGIYFSGTGITTINLISLTIQNCEAVNGGAMNFNGDVVDIILKGTTSPMIFANNKATASAGGGGGAIATNARTTLTLQNVTIINNTAIRSGGGISAYGPLTVENCLINNNISQAHGGGISSVKAGQALRLNNTTLSNNKAGFNVTTGTYSAAGNGGGVYSENPLTLSGIIVLDKDSARSGGGGIYLANNSLITDKLTSLSITNCTADANNLTISNVILSGGGIFFANTDGLSAILGKSNVPVIISNNRAVFGGGIFFSASDGASESSLSLENATFSNNVAFNDGGAIYCNGTSAVPKLLNLKNARFIANKAALNYKLAIPAYKNDVGSGGAICLSGYIPSTSSASTSVPNINTIFQGDVIFIGNESGNIGGAICCFNGATGFISGITAGGLNSLKFIGNKAWGANPTQIHSINPPGGGGAIYNSGMSIIFEVDRLNNLMIEDNVSTDIYTIGTYHNAFGGGIFSSGTVSLTNVVLTNNISKGHGGGIYAGDVLTMSNTTLSNNVAGFDTKQNPASGTWAASKGIHGGGIYANKDLNLTGTMVFSGNQTVGQGGAIWKSSTNAFTTLRLTSLSINNNKTVGNDVSNHGGGIYTDAPLTLIGSKNVQIEIQNGSSAYASGGGIYATNILRLDSLHISDNIAAISGGGVYTSNSFNSNANTYAGNKSKDGGGIYASGNTTVVNNTFSQNIATNNGGAVNASGTTTVTLSTFNANTALSGPAIYLNDVTGKILNGNIIYGNGSGKEINQTSDIAGNYNVIRGTTLPFSGTGNQNIAVNRGREIFADIISPDPDIAQLKNNGGLTRTLKLLRNGLAHDIIPDNLAWLSGINYDQTGAARIKGCNVDAGAIELQVVAPAISQWKSAGNVDDWNDPANWDNWDSEGNLISEASVPSRCTNVIIPEQQSFYPVLKKAGSVQPGGDVYAQAACDTITFLFGGEVAKTNHLSYNAANVQLHLKANLWQMISPPLRNMYAGDYFVDDALTNPAILNGGKEPDGAINRLNPSAVSIKLYQTTNPQKNSIVAAASGFSATFNTNNHPVTGGIGYAVWVDNQQVSTNHDIQTFMFPKNYNVYNYYYSAGNYIQGAKSRETEVMPRTYNSRFVYEANFPVGTDITDTDGVFTINIDNSTHSGNVIVGNPYMAHLNLDIFQNINSEYFEPQFAIWNGYNYDYLSTGRTPITTTTMNTQTSAFLAPMEPVLMFVSDSHTVDNGIPATFTPNMSVTNPGNTLLRSSMENSPEIIKLELTKDNIRQSAMALCYARGASRNYSGEKDVWTVIPTNVGSHISLYMLVDGRAASIYTTEDITTPINLGISVGNTVKKNISSGKPEYYTIRIADNTTEVDNNEVYLSDALTNSICNLSQSDYSFSNATGDITGRFQLFTRKKIFTGIDNPYPNSFIRIVPAKDIVQVESTELDPLKTITIYDLTGKLLWRKNYIDQTEYLVTLSNGNRVVIIKVETEKSSRVERLVLKKD